MKSEQKLLTLISALRIINEMPQRAINANKILKDDIQKVLSGNFFNSILSDIQDEKRQGAFNSKKSDIGQGDLLKHYIDYQSASFGVLSKSAIPAITTPITKKSIVAINAKSKENSAISKTREQAINELKETKKFIEAYNSLYSNRSLQINTPNDPTLIGSYIDYSPYTINYQYYLSIPTLSQTIDYPLAMATKDIPEIKFDDKKLSEKIKKRIRRSMFMNDLKRLLFYSDLSPRGSLLVPIIENGKVRFNVFNDTQFTFASTTRYNKINYSDNDTGVNQIYCLGHVLQNGVTAHFLCPGFESLFGIGKNKLFQLKDAAEAINIYLYTIKVLCIRAQIIVQKWSGDSQNDTLLSQMKNLKSRINSSLSLSTAIDLPGEDAAIDIINNNLTPGFAEVSPIIKEYQGMMTGVDATYFYGSDTASYSGNNFNMRITHQNIRSQVQVQKIEPALRFAVDFMLEHDDEFKQYAKEKGNYDVEFPELFEPTASEKAESDAKIIDNIIKMNDYPELEQIFKKEGVLREDHNINGKIDSPEET